MICHNRLICANFRVKINASLNSYLRANQKATTFIMVPKISKVWKYFSKNDETKEFASLGGHAMCIPKAECQYCLSILFLGRTSVAAERLFSKTCATATAKRNSLTTPPLSKLLFLNSLSKKRNHA